MADKTPRALYDSGELSSRSLGRSSIINKLGSAGYAGAQTAYMSGRGAYNYVAGDEAPELVKSHREAAAFLLGGPVGSTLVRDIGKKTSSALSNTLSRFKSNYNNRSSMGGNYDDYGYDLPDSNMSSSNKGVNSYDDDIEEINETFNNDDGTVTKRKTKIKTDKKKQTITYKDATTGTPKTSSRKRKSHSRQGGVSGRTRSAGTGAMLAGGGYIDNSMSDGDGGNTRSVVSSIFGGGNSNELTKRDLTFITYLSKSIVAKMEKTEERKLLAKFTTDFGRTFIQTAFNVLPATAIRMFNAAKYHAQLPNAKKVGVFNAMNTTLGMIYSSNRSIGAETQRLLYDIASISKIGLGVNYKVKTPSDITTLTEFVGQKLLRKGFAAPFSLIGSIQKLYMPERMYPNGHLSRIDRMIGLGPRRHIPLSRRMGRLGRTAGRYAIGGLLGAGALNSLMGGSLAGGLAMNGMPIAGGLLSAVGSIPYLPYIAGGMAGYAGFKGVRGIARSLYKSDGMMGRAFKGSILGKTYGGLHKLKSSIMGSDDTLTIDTFVKQYMANTIRDAQYQKDVRKHQAFEIKAWKNLLNAHKVLLLEQKEEHKETRWHRKLNIFKWIMGGFGKIFGMIGSIFKGIFDLFKGAIGGILTGVGVGAGAGLVSGTTSGILGGAAGAGLISLASKSFMNSPLLLSLIEAGKLSYNIWNQEDIAKSGVSFGLKAGGAVGTGALVGSLLGASTLNPIGVAVGGIVGYIVGGMLDKAANSDIKSAGEWIGDQIVDKVGDFFLGIRSAIEMITNKVESVINGVTNFVEMSIKKVTDLLPKSVVEKTNTGSNWLLDQMSSGNGKGAWRDYVFWGPGKWLLKKYTNATKDQTQEELKSEHDMNTANIQVRQANDHLNLLKDKEIHDNASRIVEEEYTGQTSVRMGDKGLNVYTTDRNGNPISMVPTNTSAINPEKLKNYMDNKGKGTSNSIPPAEMATGPTTTTSTIASSSKDLESFINQMSQKYGVPAQLIKAVIQAESGWDPNAESKAGALGMMQLMPGTAKELGVTNPRDPYQNIEGGTLYLKRMLDMFGGDVNTALAAYNWGPGNVSKYGFDAAMNVEETRNYVRRVNRFLGNYDMKAEFKSLGKSAINSTDNFLFGGGLDSLWGGAKDSADGFLFGGGVDNMWSSLKNVFEGWGGKVEDAAWTGLNSAEGALPKIEDAAWSGLGTLDKAYNEAKPSIEEAANRTKSYMSGLYDRLKPYIESGQTTADEVFNTVKQQMLNNPQIKEYLSTNYPGMSQEEIINNTIDKIKLEAIQTGNTISKGLSDANSTIGAGINDMTEKIGAVITNVASSSTALANNVKSIAQTMAGNENDSNKSWSNLRLPSQVLDLLAGNLDN